MQCGVEGKVRKRCDQSASARRVENPWMTRKMKEL